MGIGVRDAHVIERSNSYLAMRIMCSANAMNGREVRRIKDNVGDVYLSCHDL